MKKTRELETLEGKEYIVHRWYYDDDYQTRVYIPVEFNLSIEEENEIVEKRNNVEQHILNGTTHLLF